MLPTYIEASYSKSLIVLHCLARGPSQVGCSVVHRSISIDNLKMLLSFSFAKSCKADSNYPRSFFVSPCLIVPFSYRLKVYVDALGPTKAWEANLSAQFPGINFTVTAKADSKFKIVGAASVAAKVTRDAWIEGWVFEESAPGVPGDTMTDGAKKVPWSLQLGSGYPSGMRLVMPVLEKLFD